MQQHPDPQLTVMDGAVSRFSGAVALSRFVTSIGQSATEHWRAQPNLIKTTNHMVGSMSLFHCVSVEMWGCGWQKKNVAL